MITTKAGRCVVNCAPHASADGVRAGEGGNLAVGPLCRLLVTTHEFSQGGFLSYVQIQNFGVVLVDGGSYLVGVICAAGVDLPAVKLRAVQGASRARAAAPAAGGRDAGAPRGRG